MPKITEVDDVIAIRELEFRANDGTVEKAILKVGRPFEDKEGLSWCCPYELSTKSRKKVFGMHGIDPLQALDLTMKTLRTEVEYWERTQKGKFFFLDEEGAEV
ncbi:MAG: hypothetical protein KKE76_09675 [Gammaproteobacteria bacterium]|nr:hypothetical protein [Gammaproteobacteria bacterium]